MADSETQVLLPDLYFVLRQWHASEIANKSSRLVMCCEVVDTIFIMTDAKLSIRA